MNDHRKHWFIEVRADTQDCAAAFRKTFEKGSGRLGRKGRFTVEWVDVDTPEQRLVARYEGRSGMAALSSGISSNSKRIEDNATGSEISMAVEPSESSPQHVVCEIWLSRATSAVGSFGTADVGVLRPYLQDARNRIRDLAPDSKVWSTR